MLKDMQKKSIVLTCIFPKNLHIFPKNLHIFPKNLHIFPKNLHIYIAKPLYIKV